MKKVETGSTPTLYLYWFTEEAFNRAKDALIKDGVKLVSSKLTSCEVMRASGNKVVQKSVFEKGQYLNAVRMKPSLAALSYAKVISEKS